MKDKIRIAVATIVYQDWWSGEAEDVRARLKLLERILAKVGTSELLVLPAGFVRVETENAARARASQIAEFCRNTVAVAFGVDMIAATKTGHVDPLLLSFGYLARKDGSHALWQVRQLAATSQQKVRADRLRREQRVVSIGEARIGFLVCGEMMGRLYGRGSSGRRLRAMVDDANLVIDVAHADVKMGLSPRTWSTAVRDMAHNGNRQVLVAHHLGAGKIARRLKTFYEKNGPRLLAGRRSDWMARHEVPAFVDSTRVAAYVDLYRCSV